MMAFFAKDAHICLLNEDGQPKVFFNTSCRKSRSYRNQSVDLQGKSMDCFLHDRDLRHERVKGIESFVRFSLSFLLGFQNICNESTEFHFQNIDNQLCIIEQNLKNRPERSRILRRSSLLNKPQQNRTTNLLQTG